MIGKFISHLNQKIMEKPDDLPFISEACKMCVEEFRKKIAERDFKGISRFDIQHMWNNAVKKLMDDVKSNIQRGQQQ